MFSANEAVVVHIIVNGQRVEVPGITTSAEFVADRLNRNTGSLVPTAFCEVVTYHQIPAEQSRNGQARTYWKHGRQSAAFMGYRTVACPELDDLSATELLAKVEQSLAEVQTTSLRARSAMAEHAVKPKADFAGVQMTLVAAK